MDNKYENGKIYQIYSPSRPDLVYIGSTIKKIKNRLGGHLSDYRRWKNGISTHYLSSFKIFDACDDYKIHLILNYSCDSRKELELMEGKYIKMYGTINTYIGGRTSEQYKIECKEKIEKNREKMNQKFNCVCGGKYTWISRKKHSRTTKHQKYLNSI